MGPGFTALILVCSATVAMRDCSTETALDVIQGPAVNSMFGCGFESQAMIAQTSVVPGLGKDQYLKIVCIQQERIASVLHSRPLAQRD